MTWTLVWKGKRIEIFYFSLSLAVKLSEISEFLVFFSLISIEFLLEIPSENHWLKLSGISITKHASNNFFSISILTCFLRNLICLRFSKSKKKIPRFHVRYHFIKISIKTKKKRIGNSLISWRHTFSERNNLYSWKTFSSHTSLTLKKYFLWSIFHGSLGNSWNIEEVDLECGKIFNQLHNDFWSPRGY